MTRAIAAALFAAASAVAAQSPIEKALPMSLTSVFRDVPYVRDAGPRQRLDLYLPTPPAPHPWEQSFQAGPATRRMPVLVWIHGGAWAIGKKEDTVPLEWLGLGYAIASVDYRLSRDAIFPAQLQDVKAAVRWLRAQADRYARDPERIVVWGESAGGHLAALLGTTGGVSGLDVGDNVDRSSRVKGVIDFYGNADLIADAIADPAKNAPGSALFAIAWRACAGATGARPAGEPDDLYFCGRSAGSDRAWRRRSISAVCAECSVG